MADNLGPNQPRVFDPTNRSFESVVYQWKKPPLSSEANLVESISSMQGRDSARSLMPSGWDIVGQLRNETPETLCSAGDVVCSSSYNSEVGGVKIGNQFKLMALDKGVETQKLVAWVNGYRVVVQGTNSLSDENNIIMLPPPPANAYRVDSVFLEVWRKLITPNSTIYKHGNYLYGGINPANDIVVSEIAVETSLRVQVQYRIRVAPVANVTTYPEGFDPSTVYAQGPNDIPAQCTLANFSPVAGDPGLYRAGLGDDASKLTFGTVDGFIYAIPMFLVSRRNSQAYFQYGHSNGSARSLDQYLKGYASDRPDNRYNDLIVAEDILDLRHVVAPSYNYKSMADGAFNRLVSGQLRGVLSEDFAGEDHFGVELLQADIVSFDSNKPNRITNGDGYRRMFSNAQIDQGDTLVVKTVNDKVSNIGVNWTAGDQVRLRNTSPSGLAVYPANTAITSIDGAWANSTQRALGTYFTLASDSSGGWIVTLKTGTPLIGTSYPITFDYTARYPSGDYGLFNLPIEFLESRSQDSTVSYAMTVDGIRSRYADPLVLRSDRTVFDTISNKGALEGLMYDFGHQLVHHVAGTGAVNIPVPRTINGYPILGIVGVSVDGTQHDSITVTRDSVAYTVNVGLDSSGYAPAVNADVEFTLYTGGKFFVGNRQGLAIAETYEMKELIPTETANGILSTFHIDSTFNPIIALGSAYDLNGLGFAYVNGVRTQLVNSNLDLPTDSTKSIVTLQFNTPPTGSIQVPVLVKSAIQNSEAYCFLYKTVPYQGILDSSAVEVVLQEGPAIVTTAGSGAISNYSYSVGQAAWISAGDSTTVRGFNTKWLSGARAGYQISPDSTADKKFLITEVYDDTTLFVSEPIPANIAQGPYHITGDDVPMYPANIVNRLPVLTTDEDSKCKSEPISTLLSDSNPTLKTRVITATQDIIGTDQDGVLIGAAPAHRGRVGVQVPDAVYGVGTIGLQFEKLNTTGAYQKTYQSYVVEDSGRLRLMVVSSESDGTTASRYFDPMTGNDTVDVFEIPGRPLSAKRIV
jgi:hypothetical protein